MRKQRKQKNYDELEFKDDFMFGKVMEDKELCREVLECLLQQPVGELIEVQTQKELKYVSDGKPIRLDVYSEDSEGTLYDTEMQNLNRKSVDELQLQLRTRFYQSSIDTDFMNKGYSYKKLPESNIIFICTFDPFKKGLCKYSFRETCKEDPSIELCDKTVKIFYKSCYKGEDIPEDLKSLYDYVETGRTESNLTKKIDNAVQKGRRNEAWRSQYMKERILFQDLRDEGIEIGRDEGIEIGREDERFNIISSMLLSGKTVEEIVDFCKLPYDEVKKVEESLMTNS